MNLHAPSHRPPPGSVGAVPAKAFAPPSVHDALRSPGELLSSALCSDLGTEFGHNFSQVRVHSDQIARASAAEIGARAYTVGRDIVLGEHLARVGLDRQALRHELAHVVQQQSASGAGEIEIGATNAPHETFAVAAEKGAAGAARAVGAQDAGRRVLRRQPQNPDELRRRLEEVRRQLSVGSGVRSADATAKLQAEQAMLEQTLRDTAAADARRKLDENRRQQQIGSGVRSPAAIAKLKENEALLEAQARGAVSGTVTGGSPAIFNTPGANGPTINWQGGNLRGLGAEPQVMATYPGAEALPRGYPGADFLVGGSRTPLTGFARTQAGKLPLTSDSFHADGGTLIQLKTLKNSEPYYQSGNTVYKTLSEGMNKLANIEPGTGRSEQVGVQARRITHSGKADAKIFHVELEVPPTADQQAQLNQLADEGLAYGSLGPGEEIIVVVRWPGRTSSPWRLPMAPGTRMASVNAGLAVVGMIGREKLRQEQLEKEGYAPVGLAAHQDDSFLVRLGAFFRGDQAELFTSGVGPLNVPAWRANVRAKTSVKRPGESITVQWQFRSPAGGGVEDVDVTYDKQADGSWRARPPSDAPKGFQTPSLNVIIDPNVSDGRVIDELSCLKSA